MLEQNPKKKQTQEIIQASLPPMDLIQQELGSAKSMDDFFGKEGILSRVFGHTLEKLLEVELTDLCWLLTPSKLKIRISNLNSPPKIYLADGVSSQHRPVIISGGD